MLGDPMASNCKAGDLVSFVGDITPGTCSSSLRSLWTGETHVLLSLVDFRVSHVVGDSLSLEAAPYSQFFRKPALSARGFRDLVEVCCGLGGIAVGASAAGGLPILSVDRSALACKVAAANHGPVLQGDVSSPDTQAAIFAQVGGQETVITAGFPCQPYSIMGSQRGMQDPRGLTLLSILQVAWRLQANAILLECVAEVACHAATMQELERFAIKAGYRITTVVLDLVQQWPSKRRRWWAVLTPSSLPALQLQPWTRDSLFSNIRQVTSTWPRWPKHEEEDLRWSAQEQALYGDVAFSTEPRFYNLEGVAPTMVHSYGNALSQCPCGCRANGFRWTGCNREACVEWESFRLFLTLSVFRTHAKLDCFRHSRLPTSSPARQERRCV